MKPRPGEFESLRNAARVGDRESTAEQQRPAFEERLRELGYGQQAIRDAFETLSGGGTVAEVLESLRRSDP